MLFYNLSIMKSLLHIILLLAALSLPWGAAWAQQDLSNVTPQALRNQLYNLSIIYKDSHPDIQIIKERLKRLEGLEKIQKQLKNGEINEQEARKEMENLKVPEEQKSYLVLPKQTLPLPGQ